jgi:hypothetical protein
MMSIGVIAKSAGQETKPMTRDQAFSRRAELLKDRGWAKRYIDGGVVERSEMRQVEAAMVGEPAVTETPREQAQSRRNELLADPAWRALYLNGDTAARATMSGINKTLAGETGE